MIRGLFLQYLYQLSDPQLEDQLIDRLSFRRFAGLPLDQRVPDFTTFWRFRESLTTQGLVKELFAQIHHQLEEKGLLLKQGTVVDAAIINSVNRPLSDKKREQLDEKPSSQIDTDADSTKKGGRYYFGYKGHIGVDIGSKLIRRVCFTSASPHDSTVLEELVSEDERSTKPGLSWLRSAGTSNVESRGRTNPVGSPRSGPPDGWSVSRSGGFGQKMVEMALLRG